MAKYSPKLRNGSKNTTYWLKVSLPEIRFASKEDQVSNPVLFDFP